jgi:hypothetical protein
LLVILAWAPPAPNVLFTPSPTAPPVIYHSITTEACTTLRKAVLPVGLISKRDNEAFAAMSQPSVSVSREATNRI